MCPRGHRQGRQLSTLCKSLCPHQRGGSYICCCHENISLFFHKSLPPPPLQIRDFQSISDVHNPPTLSISNARCVMESPLPAVLRSTGIHSPGARSQLLVPTWPWSLGAGLRNFEGNEVSPGMKSADGCQQVVWSLTNSFPWPGLLIPSSTS